MRFDGFIKLLVVFVYINKKDELGQNCRYFGFLKMFGK